MNNAAELLQEFSRQVRQSIPLLQLMDLQFTEFNNHSLRVDMPLAPNINDKQTGFGGSIAALATTAGWAMITLLLRQLPEPYHVLVAESHIRYLAPATGDSYALSSVTESAMTVFYKILEQHKAGRITIQTVVEQQGEQVAVFTGTYKVRLAA